MIMQALLFLMSILLAKFAYLDWKSGAVVMALLNVLASALMLFLSIKWRKWAE